MSGGSEIVGAALLFLGRAGSWMWPREEPEGPEGVLEREVAAEEARAETAERPEAGPQADVLDLPAAREGAARAPGQAPAMSDPSYAALALDLLHHAIFAIDRRRRVLWRNAPARALTEEGEDLRIYQGRLGCTSARNQLRLESLLYRCLEGPPAARPSGTAATALDCRDGRTLALLLRAPTGSRDTSLGGETNGQREARPLYLIAGHSDAALPIPEASLCELYGLTPAEARVAASLAAGRSLQDYAPAVGVALSTARLQLNRALQKTGTTRQADLVRLLLSSPTALFAGAAGPQGEKEVR